jgi:hypothetical protein
MRLRPSRWALLGGFVGVLIGLLVVALRELEHNANALLAKRQAPPLSTPAPGRAFATAPPPGSADSDDYVEEESGHSSFVVQDVLRPIARAGQIDKVLEMIHTIADAGTGIPDFEDQNLSWLVRHLLGKDQTFDDLNDGDGMMDDDEPARNKKLEVDRIPTTVGDAGKTGIVTPSPLNNEPPEPGMQRPKHPAPAKKPIDFVKAEHVAAQIRSGVIRAEAFAQIGKARLPRSDGPLTPAVEADFQKACDALIASKQPTPSVANSFAGLATLRNGIWLVGPGLLGVILFGLTAQALNAVSDRFQGNVVNEIDREVTSRLKTPVS